MRDAPVVLLAEDDEGHAILIQQTLRDAGLHNRSHHFTDGQAILDFLFRRGPGIQRELGQSYVLLLDIRMPKVNGVEVLQQLKTHDDLHKLPVIILTTTDDPREVERCHELGCNVYIQKPVDYALKHGKAKKVDITLGESAEGVELSVDNNGRALPAKTGRADGGMGLNVMHYRAEMIGASLSIESIKRKGVRVVCTLRRKS